MAGPAGGMWQAGYRAMACWDASEFAYANA